jgi:biopolymer transport protein ExbB
MGYLDILKLGGVVIWVILAIGILALGVFIERSFKLHVARIRADDFVSGVINILRRNNIKEAITICEDTTGPVAHIVRTAIMHRNADKDDLIRILEDASQAEISRMERRLVVIATIAQVAPMLGLLGTVLGLLDGFLVMRASAPLVQSVHFTDSMLKALTTTAAGLIVAIPCYAAYNLLVIKIDRIVLDMERARSAMLAFLVGDGDTAEEAQDA